MYLALEFHPAALLLGLHLLGLVLLDALQETVPAHRVLHVFNAHVDPLGQDSAPGGQTQQDASPSNHASSGTATTCGHWVPRERGPNGYQLDSQSFPVWFATVRCLLAAAAELTGG